MENNKLNVKGATLLMKIVGVIRFLFGLCLGLLIALAVAVYKP